MSAERLIRPMTPSHARDLARPQSCELRTGAGAQPDWCYRHGQPIMACEEAFSAAAHSLDDIDARPEHEKARARAEAQTGNPRTCPWSERFSQPACGKPSRKGGELCEEHWALINNPDRPMDWKQFYRPADAPVRPTACPSCCDGAPDDPPSTNLLFALVLGAAAWFGLTIGRLLRHRSERPPIAVPRCGISYCQLPTAQNGYCEAHLGVDIAERWG